MDPKTPVQTCLVLSINKRRFSGFLIYGDLYFIYGKVYPLLTIFRIALSLSFFWVLGERDLSPWPDTPIAASCKLLRISPTLLPSLSPYLIPAGFLTITVYSRLALPSLRMVPYHSTPRTPR